MIGDTASISLLTGLPGSGKSLRMAEAITKLVDKGEKVYACNIEGLKVPGVTSWPDARNWRDLPSGAILFVDEAQEFFPDRRGGSAPDEVKMNRIRHDGIRLVLATQQPNYLDSYLRGLVGRHEHLLRRDGKQESFLFAENQVMDVVRQKLATIKKNYDHSTYKFNPKYFACYESAQTHTVKYQMPALLKKVLIIAPIAILLFAGPFVYFFAKGANGFSGKKAPAAAQTATLSPSSKAAASTRSTGAQAEKNDIATGEDYVGALTPLVNDVLWTAPAFIGRPIKADPHLFCMSTADTCRCVTEQGTQPVAPVRVEVCRSIARYGEPYNPYKAPEAERMAERRQEPAQATGRDLAGNPGAVVGAAGIAERAPPLQANWNWSGP